MKEIDRLRLLIVCAQCDGEDVGESWCGFQWVSRLAELCDVTVLTMHFPGHTPLSKQLPHATVIEWKAFPFLSFAPRLNRTFKPWYFLFYWRVKVWLKFKMRHAGNFDLVHQLTPMAMRFPSPSTGVSIPFVFGPVAGGLPTPPGFTSELGTEPFFTRLRELDNFRLRYDPFLRRSFEKADLVICSGPGAAERLAPLNVSKIAIETEVGVADLEKPGPEQDRQPGVLRMLYVGRIVRTKGLRDAIRALSGLRDLPHVTLDVAGDGEDLARCRADADRLGLATRVRFHGYQSRHQVEQLYRQADLFLFPSFREPTGIVLFEAMRHGLPVITTNLGGPGYIVTKNCGIRVSVIKPDQFADDLSQAIRKIADDPEMLRVLGNGARARVVEIGLWDEKIKRILNLYYETKKTK